MIKLWLARKMVQRKNQRGHLIEDLEQRHCAPDRPDFNNSIYFAGLSPEGISLVTRMSFRSDKPDENWLKIYIPGEGVIGWENRRMVSGDGFLQGDLSYECVDPGREWNLKYTGVILDEKPGSIIEVDLNWNSDNYILDFDHEGVSFDNTARRIAAEKWSSGFFRDLKELGKVHYEQGGRITGNIKYKGKTHKVKLAGVRDHSYGTRNWNRWYRHMWLVGGLENNRLFHISSINYDFITGLKAGFLRGSQGENHTIFRSPNLDEAIGKPSLPKELSFEIQVSENSEPVPVNVRMKQFFPFMMDDVYHIRQSVAEFTIGNETGTGIAELGINLKQYPDVLQD